MGVPAWWRSLGTLVAYKATLRAQVFHKMVVEAVNLFWLPLDPAEVVFFRWNGYQGPGHRNTSASADWRASVKALTEHCFESTKLFSIKALTEALQSDTFVIFVYICPGPCLGTWKRILPLGHDFCSSGADDQMITLVVYHPKGQHLFRVFLNFARRPLSWRCTEQEVANDN